MALPSYPPNIPTSGTIKTIERGQQNFLFTNLTGVTTTTTVGYGNGVGAPTNAVVFACPPSKAVEGSIQDFVIQVDAYGVTSGAGPNAVIQIYASLDALQFYPVLTLTTVSTQGAFFSLAKLITPGFKTRYITAGVTTYGGNGGTSDSVTASIFA